jgi:hypothetical protein
MKLANYFRYRSKLNILLVLAGFFLFLGFILLSSFGPKKLSCVRNNQNQVNCSLTGYVAFGFIKTGEVFLPSLKEARVDTQNKLTIESDDISGPYQTERPVYGVLLVSDKRVILDAYSYDREHQQKIVERINSFLNDSNAPNLIYQTKNDWLTVMTLSSLGLSIGLMSRMLLKQRANKALNRNIS